MRGTLFVVATPIGNLGDITQRAVETLARVGTIAAEDTRHTRKLLAHLQIVGKNLIALHEHSSPRERARVVTALELGEDVALVSDAGTPIVSDPGAELVREAIDRGVAVVPIPGPSAALAALVASGLCRGPFRFVGFLPRDGAPRHEAIADLARSADVTILFESPSRLAATLSELAAIMPHRAAAVARELTKVHEEIVRAPLAELSGREGEWLGEIVLVLGPHDPEARSEQVDDAALDARIDSGLAEGLHVKTIAERLSAWSGRPRRDVYERVVARRQARS